MNSLYPEYTQGLVKYAEEQRNSAATEKNQEQTITISNNWWDALNAQPFIS